MAVLTNDWLISYLGQWEVGSLKDFQVVTYLWGLETSKLMVNCIVSLLVSLFHTTLSDRVVGDPLICLGSSFSLISLVCFGISQEAQQLISSLRSITKCPVP